MNHRANIVENKTKWNSNNLREVIKYHTEKDSIVNEDRKRIKKYTQKKQKTNSKTVDLHSNIVIILNINGLMIAVKGQNCQSGQKSKYQITVYFQETHFKYKDTDRLKVNKWKQIHQVHINRKKPEITIFKPDKVDFRKRSIDIGKEEHFIMIKWTLCQEHLMILNVYVFNRASKYLKHQNA